MIYELPHEVPEADRISRPPPRQGSGGRVAASASSPWGGGSLVGAGAAGQGAQPRLRGWGVHSPAVIYCTCVCGGPLGSAPRRGADSAPPQRRPPPLPSTLSSAPYIETPLPLFSGPARLQIPSTGGFKPPRPPGVSPHPRRPFCRITTASPYPQPCPHTLPALLHPFPQQCDLQPLGLIIAWDWATAPPCRPPEPRSGVWGLLQQRGSGPRAAGRTLLY